MAGQRGRHRHARGTLIGSVAVTVVVAFTGWLLVANLRVNRTATVTSDTAELIEQRVGEAKRLQGEVDRLSAQVSTLADTIGSSDDERQDANDAGAGATLPALTGAGVTVELNDSPMWEQAVDASGSSEDIDKYVVHQQDIEGVINALWAGGAQAIMFEDQRLLFNSAVLCSGNVVSLHGKKYSPPFTIKAIGDQDSLIQALDDSDAVTIYRQYVDAYGLGYKVEQRRKLDFPESAALLQPLKYAKVTKHGRNGQNDGDAGQEDGQENAEVGQSADDGAQTGAQTDGGQDAQ